MDGIRRSTFSTPLLEHSITPSNNKQQQSEQNSEQ
jgi:hypothetical protein